MIIANNIYILTALLFCIVILWSNEILVPSQININSINKSESLGNQIPNQESNVNTSVGKNQQRRLQQIKKDIYNNEPLVTTLSNNEKIPLIGVGLEGLEHDQISAIITKALSTSNEESSSNLGYRLLDTSRISGNEKLISEELAKVMKKNHEHDPQSTTTIHIISKVWYTHLGYERTKMSLQESMDDLLSGIKDMPYVNIKIHVLIHWPQCYDEINWMNCVAEEEALPTHIKEASGNMIPHKNPYAYLGSWRAMEDMYNEHYPTTASIGVSNFNKDQLDTLIQAAKIKPHIYQGNLEMTSELMPFLREHNIHPQKYGILDTLTSQRPIRTLDLARRHLVSLSEEMNDEVKDDNQVVFPETLLMSYFVQNSMGIMIRTTSVRELTLNSPEKVLQALQGKNKQSTNNNDRLQHVLDLSKYPRDEKEEEHQVTKANGKVHVAFHHKRSSSSGNQSHPINIFFIIDINDDSKRMVAKNVNVGKTIYVTAHPGHSFAVHDAVTGEEITKLQVNARYGRTQWFSIG